MALEKGSRMNKWNLLQVTRNKSYELAENLFKQLRPVVRRDRTNMIHTENFILVGQERRIRGFYDGTKSRRNGINY